MQGSKDTQVLFSRTYKFILWGKFFVDVSKDFKMGGIMPEQWGRPQISQASF